MGRKKIYDEENTITITVRNVNQDEWNDLSNYIGSRSKSDFIRECITNQINKQDSVTELKREISEIRYQIDTLNDKLETKEEELAKILKAQSDNIDNELLLDKIIKDIKTFNDEKGGISVEKIKGIVREDYGEAISSGKVIKRIKDEHPEINIVENLALLQTTKSYNQEEKEALENKKTDKIEDLKKFLERTIRTEQSKSNRQISSKIPLREYLINEHNIFNSKRTEGISEEKVEEIIKEFELKHPVI